MEKNLQENQESYKLSEQRTEWGGQKSTEGNEEFSTQITQEGFQTH